MVKTKQMCEFDEYKVKRVISNHINRRKSCNRTEDKTLTQRIITRESCSVSGIKRERGRGVKSLGHSINRFIRKRAELCANIYAKRSSPSNPTYFPSSNWPGKKFNAESLQFPRQNFQLQVRLTFVTNF